MSESHLSQLSRVIDFLQSKDCFNEEVKTEITRSIVHHLHQECRVCTEFPEMKVSTPSAAALGSPFELQEISTPSTRKRPRVFEEEARVQTNQLFVPQSGSSSSASAPAVKGPTKGRPKKVIKWTPKVELVVPDTSSASDFFEFNVIYLFFTC